MEHTGLAKSAPEPQSEQIQVQPQSSNPPPVMVDGVPLPLLRYFDVDIRTMDANTAKQLKDIYDLAGSPEQDIGDVLLNIKHIDMRLGYPAYGNRFSKVWNYLKISGNIRDLQKQQEALSRN